MSEIADVLCSIGGWRVGCECHLEVAALVERLEAVGYVTRRKHYALATPEGDPAFEVTDAGLGRLRALAGDEAAIAAADLRQWYRDHTAKPVGENVKVYTSDTHAAPTPPVTEEQVARAICLSATCEGIRCCQNPAQMARRSDCPVQRGCYAAAARAVMALLRR